MTQRYVKINGKPYPFKITNGAITRAYEAEGVSIDKIPAMSEVMSWPLGRLITLIYFCIKDACRKEQIDFDLTRDDVIDAISDDPQFREDIEKAAAASKPVAKEPTDSTKKKAVAGKRP